MPKIGSLLRQDASVHRMTSKVPTITTNETIETVRQLILEHSADFDSISYVYVVTKNKRLSGVLSIRDVFSTSPSTPVTEVMTKELVKVHPKTDQEKAAHLAVKHGIKAIPVVESDRTFLGAITSDNIMAILDQESEEDLLKLSGIILGREHKLEIGEMSLVSSYVRRVPWIFLGLFGGIATAQIISGFEGVLADNILLAAFIPLVAYIANAVGTQTQTLFIRDLAKRPTFAFLPYITKQLILAAFIAISCGTVVLLVASIFWGSSYLGFVVGIAIFFAIIVATFFSLVIPFALLRFKVDPAIGSGPFSTVIQDFLSIFIYFQVASMLY